MTFLSSFKYTTVLGFLGYTQDDAASGAFAKDVAIRFAKYQAGGAKHYNIKKGWRFAFKQLYWRLPVRITSAWASVEYICCVLDGVYREAHGRIAIENHTTGHVKTCSVHAFGLAI